MIHLLGMNHQFPYPEGSRRGSFGESKSAAKWPENVGEPSASGDEGDGMASLALRYINPASHGPVALADVEMTTSAALEIRESRVRRRERLAVPMPVVTAFLAGLIPDLLACWLR